MLDYIEVRVNDQTFTGWTGVTVRRSLSEITGGVSLTYVDRWGPAGEVFPLHVEDSITVYLNGELVLTGWVEVVQKSYSQGSYSLSVEGRGRCGDLVDCTAVILPGSWKNVDPLHVMEDLCDPFGVGIVADYPSAPRMREWALDLGETAQTAVTRVARSVGAVPVEGPTGDLHIRGGVSGDLVCLTNIISVDAAEDSTERFSDYLVDAQVKGRPGHRRKKTSVRAISQDTHVSRYRPLLIRADGPGTKDFADSRAVAERNYRSGASQSVVIGVAGFTDTKGKVLTPGDRTEVNYPLVPEGVMLIESVEVGATDGGYTSTVTLVSPTKYSQDAIKVLDL